jgi:hypothetical protein
VHNKPSTRRSLSPNYSLANLFSEHIPCQPSPVKLVKKLSSLLGRFPKVLSFLPGRLSILEECLPNAGNDPIIRPNNIAEDLVISLNPHRPEARAFDESP